MATALATTAALSPDKERRNTPAVVVRDRFYRPELDVLRFAAFLSVFACHILPADPLPQFIGRASIYWRILLTIKDAGNFGVCIFFLLSSYLITELLKREHIETGDIHLGSFYMRRILRIWPLYFGVIFAFVVGSTLWSPLYIEPERVLAYSFLLGNWYIVLHPLANGPLRHLWSISVEEQFYVVWPFATKVGGMRCVKIVSLFLLPISFLTIVLASSYQDHLNVTVWLNSLVQFQFFAIGALLAIYLSEKSIDRSWYSRALMLISGLAAWLVASGVFGIKRAGSTPSPGAMCAGYALVALGSVSIFLAVLGVASGRLPKSLIYLGKISYGLYVFHEAGISIFHAACKAVGLPSHTVLFSLLNLVGSLAVTILLAMLSYKYLESPFLRLKRRFTFVKSRVI